MHTLVAHKGEVLSKFFAGACIQRRAAIRNHSVVPIEQWCAEHTYSEFDALFEGVDSVADGRHSHAVLTHVGVIKTNVFSPLAYDGQMDWLLWCERNQHNPLAPKIAFLQVDRPTSRFIVVMEKLTPHAGFGVCTKRTRIDQAVYDAFQGGIKRWFKLLITLSEYKADTLQVINELKQDIALLTKDDIEMKYMFMNSLVEAAQTVEYIDQVLSMHRDVVHGSLYLHYRAVRKMLQSAVTKGFEVDVHPGNWMLRANGSPVILDPIN